MRRILVVDDEHLVADTLALIFRKTGFEARVSYSADQALLCAREFQPELLLCDITMPERDGVALIEDIRRELPGCRVLVLTGHYENLDRVAMECVELLYPPALLIKPCHPTELIREADAILAVA